MKKVWEIKYADGTVSYFRTFKDHINDLRNRVRESSKVRKPVNARRVNKSEIQTQS